MSGVIKFNKALALFKKKFGEDYSNLDIYDEYLLSNELDLFIYIDSSVCECVQRGLNNDGFYVDKLYPYSGYAKIQINEQIKKMFIGSTKFIKINEIMGIYNSKGIQPSKLLARLFAKDLDYDFYNSLDDMEISQLNNKESAQELSITIENLFFSRTQISELGLNNDLSINLNISQPEKDWHTKEKRSLGLIIATLASLPRTVDISDPYSDSLDSRLLSEIKKIDPESKGIQKNTLGKFLEFAKEALK